MGAADQLQVTSPRTALAHRVLLWSPIAAPSLLAAALGLWNLGRPSMYGTEAVTTYAAHLPLPSLLHLLTHVDFVHGTYYLFMHVVFEFGGGTFMLRLPSVIGTVAAVVATGALALRLTHSRRVACLASTALAMSPLAGSYSQGGRSYAIDVAAATVTSLLLIRAVDADNIDEGSRWHGYTAALIVSAYLHEMTLLLIATHVVTLWWARSDKQVFRQWRRSVFWAAVGVLPLLVASVVQSGQVDWIGKPTLRTVLGLYRSLGGPGSFASASNLVLVIVAIGVGLCRDRLAPGVTPIRLAVPILVVAPVLLLGESFVTHPLYGGVRYLIWCLPAVALLVAYGLDHVVTALVRHRHRFVGAAVAVAVLLAQLSTQWPLINRQHSATGGPQDLLAAAVYLDGQAQRGDGIIYAPRSFYALELGYPHDLTAVRDLVIDESARYSGTLYGTAAPAAEITENVQAARRIWLVGTSSPAGSSRPELAALAHGFGVQSRRQVHGFTITLYVRHP